MIKIESNHKANSFYRKESLLDLTRQTEYKVTLFGVTIFQRSDKFKNDFVGEDDKNSIGFKNEVTKTNI